jgi:hypothetical protein
MAMGLMKIAHMGLRVCIHDADPIVLKVLVHMALAIDA